jgi:hypothetical protein
MPALFISGSIPAMRALTFLTLLLLTLPPGTLAQAPPTTLTDAEQEVFLTKGKLSGRERSAGKGVTGTRRVTLTDGVITHDAQIQSIDEYKAVFESAKGSELNFRDSWRFNVAAYRLDRLLGINMTPVSVPRVHDRKPSAFTWWLDDIIMDEGQRLKDKKQPPNSREWNQQMFLVRVFDQLIYNVDRNMGNLLVDKNWAVWMIDHSRAFRTWPDLKTPGDLAYIDRGIFEKLKALNKPELQKVMGDHLTGPEIDGLLARRDKIVALFEAKGPAALYDRPARK